MDGAQQPENQQAGWQFTPTEGAVPQQSAAVAPAPDDLTWTASEFVAHQKSAGWYVVLAVGAVAAAALAFWISDGVSAFFILFAAVLFGIYAARQPRELEYGLRASGVGIGQRFYPYGAFKSFAIVDEGAFSSIVFVPHKRFAPLTTIYYDPKDEDVIVAALSRHLPMEERKRDAIERLMWRIRF